MSFKNAIKILCARFSVVWSMVVATVIAVVIVISFAIKPVQDFYVWMQSNGFVDKFSQVFSSFTTSWDIMAFINAVVELFKSMFAISSNVESLLNFTLQMGFLIFVLLKFICSTLDIALNKVIQGYMSDNCKLKFAHEYIENVFKSMLYALIKTLVFLLYDFIAIIAIYYSLVALESFAIAIPFVFFFELIIFMTMRSSLFFGWSASMSVDGKGVFGALANSIVLCFKHFAKIFSGFFVSWIIIIALSVFFSLFTFGVGLVLSIPIFVVFLSVLNLTYYYGKNNMRYYLDGKIFDPETTVV